MALREFCDIRGGPLHFVLLGEAHSMYFNFFGKTRGGTVGIL